MFSAKSFLLKQSQINGEIGVFLRLLYHNGKILAATCRIP